MATEDIDKEERLRFAKEVVHGRVLRDKRFENIIQKVGVLLYLIPI